MLVNARSDTLRNFLANLHEVLLGTKLFPLFPVVPLAIAARCFRFGQVIPLSPQSPVRCLVEVDYALLKISFLGYDDGKRNAISLCYEHNRSEEDSFDLVAFPRCLVQSEGTPPAESFLFGLLLLSCVFGILLHSVLLYIYRSFHPSTRDMVNSGLFSHYNHLAKVHAANQFLLLHRRVKSLPYQNSPCSCSSSMEHRVQHWFSCSY